MNFLSIYIMLDFPCNSESKHLFCRNICKSFFVLSNYTSNLNMNYYKKFKNEVCFFKYFFLNTSLRSTSMMALAS